MVNMSASRFIAALDVGTTTIRCHILDEKTETCSTATREVELLYPKPGNVEINPDTLWQGVVDVVKDAINGAGLTAKDVTCLGMSTQRCTFITWNKKTGKPYHNLITWQDVRADSLVRSWNKSFSMKALRFGSKLLHTVTRMKRFLAGSVLMLMNQQVTLRLLWVLDNIPGIREAIRKEEVLFGTLDTYLLYRLSGGKTYVTDVTSASATGMFDPFTMTWATWAIAIFNIPTNILPPVNDSAADCLAIAEPQIWGHAIKICCSMADQGAALYGSCCFNPGDIKVTMGTGAFLNVNTGSKPHASTAGLYPVVGWRYKDDLTYVAEGASNDTGTIVNWAIKCGLLTNPQESAQLANSVPDSDGVFFIPAFSGLQAPINDGRAAAGFLGMRPSTRREHLVRAILESIVFRVTQIVRVMHKEADVPMNYIRVDGGVSLNDFVVQLLADLSEHPVERPTSSEMSILGVGFMAGVAAGVWSGKDELRRLRKVDKVFEPRPEVANKYLHTMASWEKALERFMFWYEDGALPEHEAAKHFRPSFSKAAWTEQAS